MTRERDRQDREESGQRWPQARSPLGGTKCVERRRGHPALKQWLLEILEFVETRRDPVARHRHLARDLGVATLVMVKQVARVQRREPQERGERSERPQSTGRRQSFGVRHAGAKITGTVPFA